jgi:hypothetical protein
MAQSIFGRFHLFPDGGKWMYIPFLLLVNFWRYYPMNSKNTTGHGIAHSKLAVIFPNGAAGISARSVLKPDGWKPHSGKAPVSGTMVHTLKSQQIEGTDSFAICREGDQVDGQILSATKPELEVLMEGLGYEVKLKGKA